MAATNEADRKELINEIFHSTPGAVTRQDIELVLDALPAALCKIMQQAGPTKKGSWRAEINKLFILEMKDRAATKTGLGIAPERYVVKVKLHKKALDVFESLFGKKVTN